MKLIFIFILLLLPFTIIYAVEDVNNVDVEDVDADDDEEPFDISSLGIGTDKYDQKKFVDLFMAQKQDPEKLLKMFRAIFLIEKDHEVTIHFFKPIILSSLNDDYLPGQKEAIRAANLLVENKQLQHIEKDVIKVLIKKYMLSDDISLSTKTLQTLAKIITADPKYRDLTLSFQIDEKLFKFMNQKCTIRATVLRNISKVIRALCYFGDKTLPEKTVTKLNWMIENILSKESDLEAVKTVSWAYWFLTRPPSSKQYFLLEDVVKKQIEFLEHDDFELKLVTLGLVELIIEKDKSDQIEMYLSNGFLSKIPKLLEDSNDLMVQQNLVIIGKLIKADSNYASAIHAETDIAPKVIKNIYHEKFVIKDAATLAMCYIISSSNEAQISTLIENDVINGLCHFFKLTETEDRYVLAILEGYLKILKKAEYQRKQIYEMLDECDAINVLHRLKHRRNKTISDQSEEILKILENAVSKTSKNEL